MTLIARILRHLADRIDPPKAQLVTVQNGSTFYSDVTFNWVRAAYPPTPPPPTPGIGLPETRGRRPQPIFPSPMQRDRRT